MGFKCYYTEGSPKERHLIQVREIFPEEGTLESEEVLAKQRKVRKVFQVRRTASGKVPGACDGLQHSHKASLF